MFTYQYLQPSEYHFSLDSIYFSAFVAEHLQSRRDLASLRVLDLCAGCGVIGMELSWHLRQLRQIDFLEVQDVYTAIFHKNVAIVNRPELQLRWLQLNYDTLLEHKWQNQYDVIVSNPPYFQPAHGMLSPSNFKNRCRFYLDSTFETFIRAMVNSLAPKGQAYFLMRSLKQHGNDLFALIEELLQETNILARKISQMRRADIILLEKQ